MPITNYKGFNINKDNTVKQEKWYSVVNSKVLYGGSIEVLKRKIDKKLMEAKV